MIDEEVLKKGGLTHFKFLDAIAEFPYVETIYMFGSRARGDHWEKSDIDLAIKYSDKDDYHRRVVSAILLEAKDTFLKVDCVDIDDINDEFRKIINEDKVTLYG